MLAIALPMNTISLSTGFADIRVEAIYENSTLKAPFCISGHGMPGATAADEFDKTLAFLEAIVNADDETTVGEIRPLLTTWMLSGSTATKSTGN